MSHAPSGQQSFRGEAASGAMWLGLSQAVRVALAFASTIVIARLVSPDNFGVIAMVGPVLALLAMFQDLGLGAAAIQARTLTWQQSSALFWMNCLLSGGICIVVIALAPAIAWFYHDPRAGYLAAASAATFLVGGLGSQQNTLLARAMRYRILGLIEIAGLGATFVTAVVAALLLGTYWALFFGSLAGTLVQTAASWWACGFRPGKPGFGGSGELARFGGHLTGFNLFNFLVRNLDDVLVARFAGALQAGLYDRSYKLMMMPMQNINGPVNRLLQPLLARIQDEPERYRRAFVIGARLVMLMTAPGVAVAALLADRLMPWLLGEHWQGAGAIFFWLGLTGLVQPVANLTGLLFLTTGRVRLMMTWGFWSGLLTVAAFAIGIRWGAVGIAQALFWSALIRVPLLYALSARSTPVRVVDLYDAQLSPILGAMSVALAARYLGKDVPFLPLFVGTLVLAYPASALTSCLTRDGRRWAQDIVDMVREHGFSVLARFRGRPLGGHS